jgi:hypothetical protein
MGYRKDVRLAPFMIYGRMMARETIKDRFVQSSALCMAWMKESDIAEIMEGDSLYISWRTVFPGERMLMSSAQTAIKSGAHIHIQFLLRIKAMAADITASAMHEARAVT